MILGVAAVLHGRTAANFSIGDAIAVIPVEGVILEADNTVEQIQRYASNSRIKGILLRIESPGGTVGGSQEIYSAVIEARRKKPVYVSMGNTAASGGYYIASAAEKIYANPGTVTGSIGVIFHLFNYQGITEKIGLQSEVVKSGKYKDIGSPTRPLLPEERKILQGLINDTYDQFTEAILAMRRTQLDNAQKSIATDRDGFWKTILVDNPTSVPLNGEQLLRRVADGRVYSGRQALRIGLVDQLGSEREAIDALGQAVGLPKPHVIREREKPSLLNLLFGADGKSLLQPLQRNTASLYYQME